MLEVLKNRGFLILWFGLLLGGAGQEVYNLLPKHFELQGFPPETVGFIMSFTGLGGILILPLCALFIDRLNKQKMLFGVIILHALTPLLYFIPMSPRSLYFIPRLLQGAQISLMMILFTALVSFVVVSERRVQGYAVLGIMGQIGLFTGMNSGEFFFDIFGFPAVYILSVFFFTGSILVLKMMPKAEQNSGGEIPEGLPRLSDFKVVITRKELFPVFYWIILLGFGFGFLLTFIPRIAFHGGLERVRPFYIAYPLTVLLVRSTVSSYFDRLPRSVVLIPPLVLLPLVFILATRVNSVLSLALVGVLYACAHSVLFPVLISILMNHSPVSFRGRMSVLFQLFLNGGMFLAANTGGLLMGISLYFALYVSAAFSATGLIVYVYISLHNKILSKNI